MVLVSTYNMKYTTEIEIKAPVEKVAGLLGDHEKMKHWLKELESYEPITGKPRHEGTKTRLKINIAGGVEVTETITAVDFPRHFATQYDLQHGTLLANSRLEPIDDNSTRYFLDHEFEFTGPMKLVTSLLKPAFIRHSERIMDEFKTVAETSEGKQ